MEYGIDLLQIFNLKTILNKMYKVFNYITYIFVWNCSFKLKLRIKFEIKYCFAINSIA